MKSKSPLKSDNRKKIIRITVDGENFYITSIDRNNISYSYSEAKIVRLSGDPQKAKKLVRQNTIDNYTKSIQKFFNSKIKNCDSKIELFKFNNEFLEILPKNSFNKIKERIEYYKNLIFWDDDNFNIKEAFINKDWKMLRKKIL